MKTPLFVCVFLVWAPMLLAQTEPAYLIRAGEGNPDLQQCRAIVLAPSGLKLRSKPDFKASVIAVIPYSKEVSYSCDSRVYEGLPIIYDTDSIRGAWLVVFWKGYNGYAFSAYLGNGIYKMDRPFYLLAENGGWCWDDSYISSEYQYYGAYFNADTSAIVIKKRKPTFYSYLDYAYLSTTFTFRQPQLSIFAFASREPFQEGAFNIVRSNEQLNHISGHSAPTESIKIPNTNWEIKIKLEADATYGEMPRLIIRDRKSGAWHFLIEKQHYIDEVRLNWAGDMDGDGVQDFMLSVMGEHQGGMLLFLSKNRGKNEMIRFVGKYFWQDCC